MVQLIARHTIAEGREDEVYALLPRLVEAARQEPGNLAFDVYRKLDDPRRYVLLERYASREALAEHRATDHFKHLVLGEIVPRLAERTIEEYDVTEESA